MMNAFKLFVSVLLTLCLASCNTKSSKESTSIKACTFNIRFDNPNDGLNQWDNRRLNVVTFLAIEEPDVLGMQEVLEHQLEYIEARLKDYTRVGVGRDDGIAAGEFSPIFFKDDRFTLADSGTFWLSETPEEPSIGWDAQLNRVCTWVNLEDNQTGEEIHVYNTHFSHVSNTARLNSAKLIMDSIAAKSQGMHVILMGDFNTSPGSDPHTIILEGGLQDSYDCDLRLGPEGTSNGFRVTGTFDRRIDYIFTRGFVYEYYVTNSMLIGNQYLSDHFPVMVQMDYQQVQ